MRKTVIAFSIVFVLVWAVSSVSCIQNIKNRKVPLELIFASGSNSEELMKFANNIKRTYPGITTITVLNEEDAFNVAVKFHNIKPEKIEEYRKMLTSPYVGLPPASMSVQASMKDLQTERQFKDFVLKELTVYKSLNLRQDSGSGGDRIADFFAGRDFSIGACVSPRYGINLLIGPYLH